jgi:catechol 2,3-dioxygenase-like lactoylglutathione lyase family enzyme
MTSIKSLTLAVPDPAAAEQFYSAALGLNGQVRLQQDDQQGSGFRGFTISLIVGGPASAKLLLDSALEAGAKELKAAQKSFWGFGGVVEAPDGTIVKVATSSKKDSRPASREIDQLVLLIGVADVRASKRFYVEQGLAVGKSFGAKYVEFKLDSSPIGFALYGRAALAKDAGVAPDGSGSHRLVIDSELGPLTDPDGFSWQAAAS